MKILMLTDRLALGGAETHIAALSGALRAQGHTVDIASAGGAYAKRMARNGFRHEAIPLASHSPLSLLHARRGLAMLLQRGRYDVVHAHARLPAFLCAPICHQMRIPMVTTAHWVFRADGWRGRLSRWGDYTLAVSEDIRRYLMTNYGLSKKQIGLTKNGIDTHLFYPPDQERAYRGRLIHVSRLDKGRAAAAAALLRLAPRLADVGYQSLTVVGDGNCYDRLCEEAKQANHTIGFDFIRMVGATTDIAPLLRESDVFVGVSRAALEGMACGLPTVLAGDEGYLSLLTPATASLAEQSNYCCRGGQALQDEQLLEDLTDLLRNPDRQKEAGDFAATYIREHYTATDMAKDALHAYRIAMQRASPPVIICGYYGFENMGDEAVLSHLLTMLRRDGYTNITVLSATSSSTARKHGVAACGRLSFAALRQAGRQGGILLLGGGNLLQNETSSRSLFYYTHVLRYAKQCGCRTWVIGGIGRLSPQGEARVRRSLREVEGCLARTPQDLSYFRKLCPAQAHLQLLPDGALWTQAAKALPYHLPQEEVILLALHGETKETQALIHTCATVAQHEGLLLVLACMHPAQDTAPAQRALASLPHARILPPLSPDVMVAWLKAYGRLVVATRLHALIFSAVAGVPAVTLADGGKLSAFAAYAASCDTPNAPMLTCLREKQEPVEAVRHALHAPRTKEQKRRFLSALRAPGEGFAFSAILHEKTKQHQ